MSAATKFETETDQLPESSALSAVARGTYRWTDELGEETGPMPLYVCKVQVDGQGATGGREQ